MLVACFILKLFGGNWFEVICTNEHFIYICDFIDSHLILKYIIALFVYTIPSFFIILCCSKLPNPNKKQCIIIMTSLLIVWLSQFVSIATKSILEFINTIIIPIVLNFDKNNKIISLKKSWYKGFIGYALIFIFQFISFITKNIGLVIVHDNMLISAILLIDYYIMIALYYLYIKLRKGE
jgi:hypothetical protein